MRVNVFWLHSRPLALLRTVAKELDSAFSSARQNGDVRFLKIQIVDDTLVCTAQHKQSASMEGDYRAMAGHVQAQQPCYFIFRLADAEAGSLAAASTSSQQKQRWLFVSYVPDDSPVKAKMLFGSTRETCKKQLGFSFFKDEMQTSELGELTWAAYESHTSSKCSAAPLTAAEVQSHHENVAIVHHGHTKQYVHSVKFPMSAAAKGAVQKFKSGSLNLAQFEVDPVQESIELVAAKTTSSSSLSGIISDETPRYSIYRYAHSHAGKSVKSNGM
jgi:Cofilin/tropomyosin-type actin-binding protein